MTCYYGPGANGSGIAELIGYLNGINYPDFISLPTFLTKVIGVTFAVAGKLCVGKEGPLAHIGAICGAFTLYLPGMDMFRNDEQKRVFILFLTLAVLWMFRSNLNLGFITIPGWSSIFENPKYLNDSLEVGV